MQTAEDDRRGDHQIAFRRAVFARRGALGFAHVLKDALARRDIGSSRVGQTELPARPVEEPRLEMRLKVRNLAADGRERQCRAAAPQPKGCPLRRR